jgi:hypothetical protein
MGAALVAERTIYGTECPPNFKSYLAERNEMLEYFVGRELFSCDCRYSSTASSR